MTPHYLVKTILDWRYFQGKLQYLITGKAMALLIVTIAYDVPALVEDFHLTHPPPPVFVLSNLHIPPGSARLRGGNVMIPQILIFVLTCR
jgi:hypothetical protein